MEAYSIPPRPDRVIHSHSVDEYKSDRRVSSQQPSGGVVILRTPPVGRIQSNRSLQAYKVSPALTGRSSEAPSSATSNAGRDKQSRQEQQPQRLGSSDSSVSYPGTCSGPDSVMHLPPPARLSGKLIHTIQLKKNSLYTGMAVSRDGRHLVAAGGGFKGAVNLYVHSLPDGRHIRTFGWRLFGKNMFRTIEKLCMTRRDTVLVAETWNARAQEVTLAGKHVRYIGVGVIDDTVSAIATNDLYIVVAKGGCMSDGRVFLFADGGGRLVRKFGMYGSAPGLLGFCCGIRFTPDGTGVLIVEGSPFGFGVNRLSLFTLAGQHVGCYAVLGLNGASDVEFDSKGGQPYDVLIADRDNHRVVVGQLADGGATGGSDMALRVWGGGHSRRASNDSVSDSDGMPLPARAPVLACAPAVTVVHSAAGGAPVALARSQGKLYVLDQYSSGVAVYV